MTSVTSSSASPPARELAVERAPLRSILETLVRTVESQSTTGLLGSILLLDADGVHLRHAAAPSLPATYSAAIDGAEIGPAAGSCGTAAYWHETVVTEDIEHDPRWASWAEVALAHGLRACWSTPIESRHGHVLGTFAAYNRAVGAPTAHEQELIRLVARTAALVIERAWEARERAAAERALEHQVAALTELHALLQQNAIALADARDQAEAANQAKDRFLASLSHELRLPLSPILMCATALELAPEIPEPLRNRVATIRRNVELETKLIDDLIDVSRIKSGTLSLVLHPVAIAATIAEVIELARPLIDGKALELTYEAEGEGLVRADPPRLRQILWNVLKNATKFTPRGGTIAIRSRVTDERVVVTVTDTGIGIPPEALAHVFDAFEHADPRITQSFGGLGLGLAISRSLAVLHGGTLAAASHGPDLGATFTLTLPHFVMLPAPEPAVTPEVTTHPRVLVVDDHDDTADIIATLLEVKGYQVAVAHNVADALAHVTTEQFDLLLSDIGLPDASGYDLMRKVREQHPMKGIAMSGWGRDEDIARGRAAGFSEHLVKPLDLGVLMSAIQRVLHT